jgi:MoaA/NifB/PqqE/SkfB family radical SAM enzyme
MAWAPAFDSMFDPSRDGKVLTFILPAQKCNLSCPVCIIRQRKEIEKIELQINDYVSFIRSAQSRFKVSHIAIQGHEPLLPESWPFTSAILNFAHEEGIDASLVTNGVFLDRYLDKLLFFSIKKFSVSLDAPSADWHDAKRGIRGAFDATSKNIALAAKTKDFSDLLWVTSLLYPDNVRVLFDMPKYLKSLNVKQWSVSPLFRIGDEGREGGVEFSYDELKTSLLSLYQHAMDFGITFRVDDEFDKFHNEVGTIPFSAYRRIERIENLVRLSPSGFCSVGKDILRTITDATPKWNPGLEDANVFFDRLAIAKV